MTDHYDEKLEMNQKYQLVFDFDKQPQRYSLIYSANENQYFVAIIQVLDSLHTYALQLISHQDSMPITD